MDQALIDRAYRKAEAARWRVTPEAFAAAIARGLAKAAPGREPSRAELDAHLSALHLEDLALACACEAGDDEAWDHFIREFRPTLYRAADAIDPGGRAREAADALYGELYGAKEKDGQRQSLFRYFHGRSSLATWLRAILSQRYVDLVRAGKRTEPLEEKRGQSSFSNDPQIYSENLENREKGDSPLFSDAPRFAAAMQAALAAAIAALAPRDRLRLGCYYAQQMTLAAIGKVTREHEATVSRQLARTRQAVRADVERRLRETHGWSAREIDECFAAIVEDPGEMDVDQLVGTGPRKNSAPDRSESEGTP